MSEVNNYYNSGVEFGTTNARKKKIVDLVMSGIGSGRKVILDIGCASGYFLDNFRNYDNYLVGIDIAEKSIAEASKKINEAYVVDVESYPWHQEVLKRKYDIIICTEVIEHLYNPEKFLDYVSGLLSEEGYLVLSTPNFLMWKDRIKMLLGVYEVTDFGHIRLFSHYGLTKILKSRFEIIDENHLMHPRWVNKFRWKFLANLFAFQMVFKLRRV